MVELQEKAGDRVVTIRCPTCDGLWAVKQRAASRYGPECGECRRGNVVRRSEFHDYWLVRFTRTEIVEMASAIWG